VYISFVTSDQNRCLQQKLNLLLFFLAKLSFKSCSHRDKFVSVIYVAAFFGN